MPSPVLKALDTLELLQSGSHSLGAVATHLDCHKSTALRLLRALEERKFVRRSADGSYSLGIKIFDLSAVAIAQIDIRRIAYPAMLTLGRKTKQTVHLAGFDGTDVVYLAKVEATGSVRMYSRVGSSAPLHCTGIAKAILSQRPRSEVAELLSGYEFTTYTANTIGSWPEFETELNHVKQLGYAIDEREHEDFIRCVAVPLHTDDLTVSHSLSIASPTMMISHDKLLEYLPTLYAAAAAIEEEIRQLGGSPKPSRPLANP